MKNPDFLDQGLFGRHSTVLGQKKQLGRFPNRYTINHVHTWNRDISSRQFKGPLTISRHDENKA